MMFTTTTMMNQQNTNTNTSNHSTHNKMTPSSSSSSTSSTSFSSSLKDRIAAMIWQEDRFYQCRDYLNVQEPEPVFCSPLHVVAECAALVSDVPMSSSSLSSYPCVNNDNNSYYPHINNNNYTKSPSGASNFPSPVTSMKDLYGFSSRSNNSTAVTTSSSSSTDSLTSMNASPMIPTSQRKRRRRRRSSTLQSSYLMSWRHQMFDWTCSVVQTYNIHEKEVVAVAFSILDRYVASILLDDENENDEYDDEQQYDDDDDDNIMSNNNRRPTLRIHRDDYQLYSMIALYIAIKVIVPFRKLTIDTLIDMSSGYYSMDDITSIEMDILQSLQWHIHTPTIDEYCHIYLALYNQSSSSSSAMMHKPPNGEVAVAAAMAATQATCYYLSELALDDVYFITKSKSLIALAITLLAGQKEGIITCIDDTQRFLSNLQGLVNVQCNTEFDMIVRRLECLLM